MFTWSITYEIPRAAVIEGIVNAVAHRMYNSNASVQVMLFRDRLEIWNPGRLPFGLTTAKLRGPHPSIPANPLLAEPMYLAGYIERMGTGTGDIIRLCKEAGLRPPEFIEEDIFKVIFWRRAEKGGQVGGQADLSDRQQEIFELIKEIPTISRKDIVERLGINASAVQKHINVLKQREYIRRDGKTTGAWIILNTVSR